MRAIGCYLSLFSVSRSVMVPCDDRTSSIYVAFLASIYTCDPPGPEPGFFVAGREYAGCRTLSFRSAKQLSRLCHLYEWRPPLSCLLFN